MDTSSRTKSVERPVRAVDLFIASLDALTLLEGSSTLSARIDSDERATLLASLGWSVRTRSNQAAGKGEDEFSIECTGKRERIVLWPPKGARQKNKERTERTERATRTEEENEDQKKNGRWAHR